MDESKMTEKEIEQAERMRAHFFDVKERVLPAGSMVKIAGVPVMVKAACAVLTTGANWSIIKPELLDTDTVIDLGEPIG